MARLTGNITVVCVAQFVVVLDTTIVTTALPVLGPGLGFAEADLPWVVTAYTLVFGALLVPCGRVADLFGARRVFRLGMLVFVAASAACAVAWTPGVLIAARAVQGLGSALLSPAALALLMAVAEPGAARRAAVGWWTAAAACGGASGWLLGGLLTEFLGWRAVFWVNVPIGLLLLAIRGLPAGTRDLGVRVDVAGAVGATATLGLLVYGLTSVVEHGLLGWVPLVLTPVAATVLVRHLRRRADPLLPVLRTAAGANLTALGLTAATTPVMYLSTLYVQEILRWSPARAALLFPVFNLAVVAGSLAAPVLLRVLAARRTLVAGFATIAAGAIVFATLPRTGTPVASLVAGFAVLGVGLGAASVASTHAGTEAAAPEHQGVASGALSSSAQVGTALGLAALAPVASTPDTYRLGFLGGGVLAVAGMAVSLLVPSRSERARISAS
jgi:MFS family permease